MPKSSITSRFGLQSYVFSLAIVPSRSEVAIAPYRSGAR